MILDRRESIGKNGLEVTRMGFGGAPLGNLFTTITEKDVTDCLDAAYNAGIRYFDTAPLYGFGLSETRYGANLPGRRDEIILSTKVGRVLKATRNPDTFEKGFWAGGLPFEITYDYSYDGARRSIACAQLPAPRGGVPFEGIQHGPGQPGRRLNFMRWVSRKAGPYRNAIQRVVRHHFGFF